MPDQAPWPPPGGRHRATGLTGPTRRYALIVLALAVTSSLPILTAIGPGAGSVGDALAGDDLSDTTPFIPPPSPGPVVVIPLRPEVPERPLPPLVTLPAPTGAVTPPGRVARQTTPKTAAPPRRTQAADRRRAAPEHRRHTRHRVHHPRSRTQSRPPHGTPRPARLAPWPRQPVPRPPRMTPPARRVVPQPPRIVPPNPRAMRKGKPWDGPSAYPCRKQRWHHQGHGRTFAPPSGVAGGRRFRGGR